MHPHPVVAYSDAAYSISASDKNAVESAEIGHETENRLKKLIMIWRALHEYVNFVHGPEKPYRSLLPRTDLIYGRCGIPVVRPAGISAISGTYSSTVDFWIMYKNLRIHAMRATFRIVFSVRIFSFSFIGVY